jgi:hypothetical protein
MPTGDSALGALGTFFSGLVKGDSSTAKASAAAPAAADSGGAACADGSCSVK